MPPDGGGSRRRRRRRRFGGGLEYLLAAAVFVAAAAAADSIEDLPGAVTNSPCLDPPSKPGECRQGFKYFLKSLLEIIIIKDL